LTVTPTDPTDFTFTFAASSERKVGANRIHLDLSSQSIDDQHETAARLISIGASEVNIGQEPDAPHIVLADPDGNEFCVLEPGNKFGVRSYSGHMTSWERLQLLVGGFGEEQAERALELLSPLVGADAQPGQQVRQLPAFVGIGDSGRSDVSEHVDDLLDRGFGE
jgi:hypothetical protein